MSIRLYCGVNEKSWNGVPVIPGEYACLSPVYGAKENTRRVSSVKVPAGVQVIQDSGAFSDSLRNRLSFEAALTRQKRHADKYGYADQITHRASYDVLIDEIWSENETGDEYRTKHRWSVADAEEAVDLTVNAARYLHQQRTAESLIISAQGVDANQYLGCIKRILPYYCPGDLIGLGGWCIIGKMPKIMMPVFKQTCQKVIPFLAEEGISAVHIWGVIYDKALAELLFWCDQVDISVSTDSAGPSYRPAFGNWGYSDWVDRNYERKDGYWRGIDRVLHVEATRQWLLDFRKSKAYQDRLQSVH